MVKAFDPQLLLIAFILVIYKLSWALSPFREDKLPSISNSENCIQGFKASWTAPDGTRRETNCDNDPRSVCQTQIDRKAMARSYDVLLSYRAKGVEFLEPVAQQSNLKRHVHIGPVIASQFRELQRKYSDKSCQLFPRKPPAERMTSKSR